MTYKLLLLPGDGIGPEVMAEVSRVIAWVNAREAQPRSRPRPTSSAAAPTMRMGRRSRTRPWRRRICRRCGDARRRRRPQLGRRCLTTSVRRPAFCALRKDLELFANLRPAICYPALAGASWLKRDRVDGLDIMIVRELTGGVYFGEPKEIKDLGNGQKRAVDADVFQTYKIEHIARSPSSSRGFAATRCLVMLW